MLGVKKVNTGICIPQYFFKYTPLFTSNLAS